MIGFSLSLCVSDIKRGIVDINDVEMIRTGTCARSPREWAYVLNSYWPRDAEAQMIANKLMAAGKILQPRVGGNPPPDLTLLGGHWS